jgi:hypothetical protein
MMEAVKAAGIAHVGDKKCINDDNRNKKWRINDTRKRK